MSPGFSRPPEIVWMIKSVASRFSSRMNVTRSQQYWVVDAELKKSISASKTSLLRHSTKSESMIGWKGKDWNVQLRPSDLLLVLLLSQAVTEVMGCHICQSCKNSLILNCCFTLLVNCKSLYSHLFRDYWVPWIPPIWEFLPGLLFHCCHLFSWL